MQISMVRKKKEIVGCSGMADDSLHLMKKFVHASLIGALATSFASAATMSISTTAPTIDGDDIANLATSTGSQLVWGDRPMQGQTFTTGANAAGYELNSITVKFVDPDDNPGPANLIEGWKDYRFRVSTFSGTTENPFVDVVARYTPDATDDNYFTITFTTPLALNASTLYGFSMSITNSEESWPNGIPGILTTGDEYAGGSRYSTSANQNTYTNLSSATVSFSTGTDLLFHMDIAAIPEPTTALLGSIGLMMLLRRRR